MNIDKEKLLNDPKFAPFREALGDLFNDFLTKKIEEAKKKKNKGERTFLDELLGIDDEGE